MKFVIALLFVSSFAVAAPTGTKKVLPVTKEEEAVKKDKLAQEKLKMLDKKEEDCDEKAKKPVEIKPESLSLSGNAGCTLE
jgi:heat shock protein HslJ